MINKEKNKTIAITISKTTYKMLSSVSKLSAESKSKVIETILVDYFSKCIEEFNKRANEKKGA